MLWVASQTSIPAAIAKTIMLLPIWNVKSCAKYQFLEEIDEQCRSISVQKPGTAGLYALHVTKNSAQSSLVDFSRNSLSKNCGKVELLTCSISWSLWRTVVQEDGSQVPPECVIYGYVVNNQSWELNLVQKLMTTILGVEHPSHKVSIILVTTSNFSKNKTWAKSCRRLKEVPFLLYSYIIPFLQA